MPAACPSPHGRKGGKKRHLETHSVPSTEFLHPVVTILIQAEVGAWRLGLRQV